MTFKRKLAGIGLTLSLLLGSGGVFAAQNPVYDRITDEMTGLRELELLEPIDFDFQTRDELQEWLAESLDEYPEEDQAIAERILVVFGFIEPGTDIRQLEGDLLGEQISGYYEPESNAMVVVVSGDGDEITATQEITFAHEVVHALQDQHFDLVSVQDRASDASDDEYLAMTAMIEGDASLSEVLYVLEYPELLQGLQDELADFDSTSLDAAPLFYSETLLFPYDQGALFVAEVYSNGGWEAVNAMYEAPPVSTEQILHPEKYLEGEVPIDVTVVDPSDALGEGWEVLDENVMGEFTTDVFLRNGGAKNRDARDASEGWGGDAYIVVGNEDETAFVWTSTWDTDDDADEFFEVLVETESGRLGGDIDNIDGGAHIRIIGDDYVGEIILEGDTVTYTVAENVETLDTMTGR